MTDREICEKIVDNDAFRSEMGSVCDNFLCPECPFNDCDCGANNDTIIELAKKWLADHPADNGWQPLEVDNLPSDILTGDYEFQSLNFVIDDENYYEKTDERAIDLLVWLKSGQKYRYRKRQEEKSVKELADKYIETTTPKGIIKLHTEPFETMMYHTLDIKHAYIAGYKAAKDE
jgi:hypothetical protein